AWYRQGLGDEAATAGLTQYFASPQGRADPHPFWQQAWVDTQVGHTRLRLEDYLGDGQYWHLRPHPLFDPDWYAAAVDAHGGPSLVGRPLLHFACRGWDEAASPHRLFDASWYAGRLRRLAGSARNPLLHYLQSGYRSGRRLPHPLWEQAHVDAQTG